MEGRRKKLLFGALTAVISLVLTLVPAELLLRFRERRAAQSGRPRERLDLLEPNPTGTGSFRLKPGLRLVTSVQGRRIEITTNRFGMRWREVGLEKPAGRRRVAFLGDSYTFGCWSSSIERSFVGVFEKGISPTAFEVLNFGVGGYGIGDEELLLREQVIRFSPDHVMLMFFNGNDFRDTYLGLRKDRLVDGTAEVDPEVLRQKVPAEFLVNDRVEATPAPETSALKSRLRQLASYRALEPLLGWENPYVEFGPSRRFMSYAFWSRVPYPDVARRARDESLAALGRINAFCRERGVSVAVVAIPTHDQVYSGREWGRDFDIAFPQVYVQVFAREQGIPFLDLLPPFRAYVRERHAVLYVPIDQHLNDAGHALAGETIAEWFRLTR